MKKKKKEREKKWPPFPFFIFKPFYLLFRFILYGVAFCIIVFQRLSIR